MSCDKPENEDLEKFELQLTVLKHEENYKRLHEKYNSCLKTIEILKNENKLLRNNITNMESNFASLLPTVRTELRKKTLQLDELKKETGKDSSEPVFSDHESREKISAQVGLSPNQFHNYSDQNKEYEEKIEPLHKKYWTSSPKIKKITPIKSKTISLKLEDKTPIALKGDHVANLLRYNEPCLDQHSFKGNENIHVSKTSSGLEISFNKDSTKNNLENTNALFESVTIYSKRREMQKPHIEDSDKEGKVKVAIAGVHVPEHNHKNLIPENTKVNENVSNCNVNHKLDEHKTSENHMGPSELTRKDGTQQNKYNDNLFDDFLLNELERNYSVSSESKKFEPKSAIKTNESKSSAFEDFSDSEKDIFKSLSESPDSKTEVQQVQTANIKRNKERKADDNEGKYLQDSHRKRPRSYDFLDLTNSSVNFIKLDDLKVAKDLNESQNDLDTSDDDRLFIDVEGLEMLRRKTIVPENTITAKKDNFTVLRPKKRKNEEFHLNTPIKTGNVILPTMEADEISKNTKERNLNNISEDQLQNDKCENKENIVESNRKSQKPDSIVRHHCTQNDSVRDRKTILIGSSTYLIERVSNDVVNVFITRNKKKRKIC